MNKLQAGPNELTIDKDGWKCQDKKLEADFNELYPPTGSTGDPVHAAVSSALADHQPGLKVIERDEPSPDIQAEAFSGKLNRRTDSGTPVASSNDSGKPDGKSE